MLEKCTRVHRVLLARSAFAATVFECQIVPPLLLSLNVCGIRAGEPFK